MKIKNVFLVTPIGEEGSPARIHASRMLNYVFDPLKEDLEYPFENILTAPELSVIGTKNVYENIKNADIVIADVIWDNVNVFYEIGFAHALNKPVILISPKGYKAPFDINDQLRIEYDKDKFDDDSRNAVIFETLRNDLKKKFRALECTDVTKFLVHQTHLAKDITPEVIPTYNKFISDLKTLIEEKKNVMVTEYIKGENNAFAALTEAVKNAKKSIKSTRFSPYTVVRRQTSFYETIRHIMNPRLNKEPPESFQRIVTANSKTKLEEVTDLVTSNMGFNFTIYLSRHAYNFEIVIVNDMTVFIHFCKDREDAKEIISATLKIENIEIATEFSGIFDSIVKHHDTFHTIRCIEINKNNLAEKITEIENIFEKELQCFDENCREK